MQAYLNDRFLPLDEASISPMDRGYLFGDGIYEVIRVIEGETFKAQEHLARMDQGLQALEINLDQNKRQKIEEVSRQLLEMNRHQEGEATIYVQVTRGTAIPRTHVFPEQSVEPTLFITTSPFTPHKDLHQKGVNVITVADVRWKRCNLKTTQLLPNTLAREQAKKTGANSAMLIRDGVVTESPNANIFAVKNEVLYTFPASHYILNGVTRQVVIEIANDLDIPLIPDPVREEEIFSFDEFFFTGTTTDIQPITMVNGKPIGNGQPGPVVRKVQEAYNELLYKKTVHH